MTTSFFELCHMTHSLEKIDYRFTLTKKLRCRTKATKSSKIDLITCKTLKTVKILWYPYIVANQRFLQLFQQFYTFIILTTFFYVVIKTYKSFVH